MVTNGEVNLISIGGASRSGSTLLSLLLGRVNGAFPVGELRYIWSRGFLQNQLCGCGVPFRSCSFWRAVLEEAYGSLEQVPIHEIIALHASVAQVRYLPNLMSPVITPRFQTRVKAYLPHLERLCRAIRSVSGASILIDSSKQPAFCYLMTRLSGANVRLVQLVRDSRAVAFSYRRKKTKPDSHWGEAYMTQFSPPKSAFHWIALNLAMEGIRAIRVPCQLIRYEDLVRDPGRTLQRIHPSIGEMPQAVPSDEEMSLTTNHSVSGNPIRFQKGSIRVHLDTDWEQRMSRSDRLVVSAITLPLLIRYKYVGAR